MATASQKPNFTAEVTVYYNDVEVKFPAVFTEHAELHSIINGLLANGYQAKRAFVKTEKYDFSGKIVQVTGVEAVPDKKYFKAQCVLVQKDAKGELEQVQEHTIGITIFKSNELRKGDLITLSKDEKGYWVYDLYTGQGEFPF